MRADVIKLLVTGGVMTDGSDVGVLQWGPTSCRRRSHRLINWAVASPGIVTVRRVKEAIRAGLDTVEHGTLLDDEAIALMLEHGTHYIPTMVAPFHICVGGTASGIPAYAVQKSHLVMGAMRASVRPMRWASKSPWGPIVARRSTSPARMPWSWNC